MSSGTVLLAGSSGTLGTCASLALLDKGYRVRAIQRSPKPLPTGITPFVADLTQPETLDGVCNGIDYVVSCAGARMTLGQLSDRQSFLAVDHQGNENLLTEARRAGVRRFVYVSLANGPELRDTVYADAHERFVDHLAGSGLPFTVIRPTGFFQFFGEVFDMRKKGRALLIGDGTARTNPIDAADAARACAEAVAGSWTEMPVGGPDIFSRAEIIALASRILNRPIAPLHVSPALMRVAIAPLRLLQPRLHALADFGIAVSLEDGIAPAYGKLRLEDYFRARLTGKA